MNNLAASQPFVGWSKKVFCKISLLFFLMLFALPSVRSQVQFKVELLSDNVTYRVSMLPSVTWAPPLNITSTALVSMKVPTGGFSAANVTSLIPGTFWASNSQYSAPVEAPGFDYISFGLTSIGTDDFTYESGVEVALFTFQNNGTCTGPLEIIEMDDPFYPPNSLNANVTNQLTTIGSGNGSNAFTGAYETGSANCAFDLDCLAQYQLEQLADGGYMVSMSVDTAWSAPQNITEELMVTLVAPTGSVDIGSLNSLQSGVFFNHTDTYSHLNSDYFIFELVNTGTSGLSYQRGLSVPLFSFNNEGTCSGDSLALMDNETDPFAMPNVQNAAVGQFLRTAGSGITLEPCPLGQNQPLIFDILLIEATDLTDCGAQNGTIRIETSSLSSLEFSINAGATWQESPIFTLLPAGSYEIMARYSGGQCAVEYDQNPVAIEVPEAPEILNVSSAAPTGCGAANGFITIQANGNGFQEFSIDNGETWQAGGSFVGLTAGTYLTAVRNADMTCPIFADTLTLGFNGPSTPVIDSVISQNLSSCSAINGGIKIESSSLGNLEFSIDNGETWQASPVFEDLDEGNYLVQIREDATGCVDVYPNNPVAISAPNCSDCLVEYELELLADGSFQVSVIPDTTWNFPQNVTSTAQVTLVVPTGSFQVTGLSNLISGVVFNDNSIIEAPIENPGFDYISFGLESLGTTSIPYEQGIKVPLFTFRNSLNCSGTEVRLMENETDPFAFPNSQAINVGQQLTTIGSGQDGLVCIKDPGLVPCAPWVDAISDTINVFVNTAVVYNILDNDFSFQGHPMTASLFPGSAANHGTFTLQPNGTVTYLPDPGFTGIDTLLYVACENIAAGTCDIGVIAFVVSSASEIEAVGDTFQTTVNTPLTGTVATNDLNPNNQGLIVEIASQPSNGILVLNPDGTFTYSPNLSFVGFDNFLYQVCGDGFPTVCDYGEVQIQVNGSTELLAIDDNYFGPMGSPVQGNVSNNDFNPNGGLLSVISLPGSGVQNGTLTLNIDGTFEYIPSAGFAGIDGFEYVICENMGSMICDTANVQFSIFPDIVAVDDSFDLEVNTTVSGQVLDNDIYPTGINVTPTLLQGVGQGGLNFNPDGTFTYTPDIGFVGSDFFTYEICSSIPTAVCDTALVSIQVNSNLEATDDEFMVSAGSPFTGEVLGNDVVPNGLTLTVSLFETVDNGALSFGPDGTFTYLPNNGFLGEDTLVYQICDDNVPPACDTATVIFTVTAEIIAVDDVFETEVDNPLNGNVTDNDLISAGTNVSVTVIDPVSNGQLTLLPNGTFEYLPNPGFTGVDVFEYEICETSPGVNCDTAECTLIVFENIIAVNDTVDLNINETAPVNLLANDTFPNILDITIIILAQPNDGDLTVNPTGSFDYTPDYNFLGEDEFTYVICSTVTTICDTATVTLNVTTELLAVDDSEQVPAGEPFSGNVTDNDIFGPGNDPSDFTVTVLPGSGPQNGTLVLNPDGTYTYVPDSDFIGNESFEYVICNAEVPPLCDTAMVNFFVAPLSLFAVNDTFVVFSDNLLLGEVLPNDLNPNGGTMTVNPTPVTPPSVGNLGLGSNGNFIYAPPFGFVGTVTFDYEVCNDLTPQECDTATVFIKVNSLTLPEIVCPGEVCENENIVISTTEVYPADAVFEWQNGNGEIISSEAALNIPANSAEAISPYRVRVWQSGLSAGFSAACYVEVLEIPAVFATVSGPVCENGAAELSATSIPDATYAWRISGTLDVFSTQQNTLVPNVSDDIVYEVIVSLNQCGLSATDTVLVEVTEPPAVDIQADFFMQANCSPSDLNLSANAVGTGLTYSWAGPNGFVSSLENPSISNLDLSFNGNYTVTVTNGEGCSSVGNYVVTSIVESIPEPIITTTGPTCSGQEIELFTQLYIGADVDYEWMFDGSSVVGNSSNQLVLPEVQMTEAGYYQVKVKVDDCTTLSDSFYVEILQSPSAIPTVDPINDPCGSEPVWLHANASNFGNFATYDWTGPNGFTSAAADPIIPFPTSQDAGVYTLEVTAENGCAFAADVTVDSIRTKPLPATLEVADGAPCVGETLELQAIGVYSGQSVSYQWYFDNGTTNNALAVTSAPSFFIPSVSSAQTGVYSVYAVVDGCISNVSNLKNVTVLGADPIPANNSANLGSACEGEDIYLSTAIIPGATYEWFGPAGFYSTDVQPVLENIGMTDAGGYFAFVEKQGCFTNTDTTFITVAAQPSTPFLLVENEVCESDSLVLSVLNPPMGSDVSFEFFHALTGERVDSTENIFTTIYNISPTQMGEYFAVTYVDGCASDASASQNVTVQEIPQNIAFAGTDETLCEIMPTAELNALAPSIGVGEWSSPSGAVIPNFNLAETQATNLQVGENIFVWSLSYGACENYSTDTVVLSMVELPNEAAFAGTDINSCTQDTIWLNASGVSTATGEWSQSVGQAASGATIAAPNNPSTAITGLMPGQEYVFTWALTSGFCENYSVDEVVVNVADAPAGQSAVIFTDTGSSNMGADTLALCDEMATTLEANTPSVGYGTWLSNNGASVFNPNSSATTISNLEPGANTFVWALSFNACEVYSTDTITVWSEDVTANDDAYSVSTDNSIPLDLLLNDNTQHVSEWELTIVNPPVKGTIGQDENGDLTYTPLPGVGGTDEFTYMLCSKNCEFICDMATVQLNILGAGEGRDIFVPNTITPNNDGVNDAFVIPAVADHSGSELVIFNRWGNEVYFSKDYQNDWQGTFEDQPVPEGTYFYCLILNDDSKSTARGFVAVRYE